MSKSLQIEPYEAHEKVKSGGAILVCANEEPDKFQDQQLEGAISLQEFRSHGAALPWDQEVIFYCDSQNDEVAFAEAAKLHALGFLNAKVLHGGVKAWLNEGYRLI